MFISWNPKRIDFRVLISAQVEGITDESGQNNKQLCLATLDAQKAFDVVHHTILLDRLAELDIPNNIWLIIIDLYSDISSRVKLLGDCSDSFAVSQGVRQGAIISTHIYKVYVDPLLNILKDKRLGFFIVI